MAKNNSSIKVDLNGITSLERSVCMAGGLLLTLLGQHLMQKSPHAVINFTLILIGAASFLLGIISSSDLQPLKAISRVLFKFAGYLGVSNVQVLFILYGLLLALASRSAAGNSLIAHSPWYGLIWIAGCLFVIVGCWQKPRVTASGQNRRLDWVAAGLVLAVSLAARMILLDQLPYTVSGDEGSVGLMAWDYKTGLRNNFQIMGWFSFPALQFWLPSLMQEILGRSVLAIRIPSAIGGALAVLATFWACRSLFGRLPGILAALFLSTFHYHLLFSRISLANIWDGFFLMIMIAALWIAWQSNERYAFLIAGAAIGLSQFFYTTSHLLPLYAVLWLITLRLSHRTEGRLPGLICLAFVLLAVVFPLVLFYIENPNELIAPLSRVSLLRGDWIRETTQATGKSAIAIFTDQFWKTILGFTARPLLGVYSPGSPMLLTIPATMFLAGLLITLLRIKDTRYTILLIGLLGPILASTFSVGPPNSQRLLFSAPIVAIILVLPLDEIRRQLTDARPKLHTALTTAMVAFILIVGVLELDFFHRAMDAGRYSDKKSYINRRIGDFVLDLGDDVQVYYLGQPVMGYATLPNLPYIANNATGRDLVTPVEADLIQFDEGNVVAFIFLPENFNALGEIEQRCPGGTTTTVQDDAGEIIFKAYVLQA